MVGQPRGTLDSADLKIKLRKSKEKLGQAHLKQAIFRQELSLFPNSGNIVPEQNV